MKQIIYLLMLLIFIFGLTPGRADESFIYDDKGKRDPFLPLVDERGKYLLDLDSGLFYSSGEVILSGILWDPQGKSSALINNQVVKIGDSICGFTIENITKNSVVISKGSKEYILKITVEEKE